MKLIKFYDNNETKLFDLKNDMSENKNLGLKRKRLADKLEKKMSNFLKDVKAPKWKPGITWKGNNLEFINSFH
jgi:hypothetical protein